MSHRLLLWLIVVVVMVVLIVAVARKKIYTSAAASGARVISFTLGPDKTNTALVSQNTADGSVMVQFDAAWKYSWRNDLAGPGRNAPFNYDGLWIFVKYRVGEGPWKHATLEMSGVNAPAGFAFTAPTDKKGVFLHRATNGFGNVNLTGVEVRWNYQADGVADDAQVSTEAFMLEMVYIPSGAFYAGDDTRGVLENQFYAAGGTGFPPFQITGENPVTLGGTMPGSLNSRSGDDFNSTIQSLPAAFPKGYRAFWILKFELSSQQWCDFLNHLEPGQIPVHDTTMNYGMERHAITKADITYVTPNPTRPVNFMNFNDLMAFADWAVLRPLTELEYEKACRGPNFPVPDEFAWGTTSIVQITGFSGMDGSGLETARPISANCSYNLQNGSPSPTDQPIQGPVRAGIFLHTNPPTTMNPIISRQLTGASYYWVFELSGNVWERCVNISSAEARTYNGNHGDGTLDAAGQANQLTWPNLSGGGAGYRGGNWYRWSNWARVSSRSNAPTHDLAGRTSHRGIRAVRTAP